MYIGKLSFHHFFYSYDHKALDLKFVNFHEKVPEYNMFMWLNKLYDNLSLFMRYVTETMEFCIFHIYQGWRQV